MYSLSQLSQANCEYGQTYSTLHGTGDGVPGNTVIVVVVDVMACAKFVTTTAVQTSQGLIVVIVAKPYAAAG
jgi:hypothetical protein